MVKVCEESGVFLLNAEQLCFAPRYVGVKELIEEGAFAQIIQLIIGSVTVVHMLTGSMSRTSREVELPWTWGATG